MATQLTWLVDSLQVLPQADGQADVVSAVNWRLAAVDGECATSIYGSQPIPFEQQDSFIPYASLTQDVVIAWVKTNLGAAQVAQYEQAVTGELQALITPSVLLMSPPWSGATA